jgi:hypothetical protein
LLKYKGKFVPVLNPNEMYVFFNVCRNWTSICIHSDNRIVRDRGPSDNCAEVADNYSDSTKFVPEFLTEIVVRVISDLCPIWEKNGTEIESPK